MEKIRNVAIIAHVDHGKTTLVDAFLKQTNVFRENQQEMSENAILDFNELERERGITIKAKNISVSHSGFTINIIDTPGHADFGGEVERTLNMADGCLLIVDAQEGPMPQTKFVLKKALEYNLKVIVVINKIDKPYANIEKTLDKVNDLFLNLVTEEDQLEFPVFYAVGREGKAYDHIPTKEELLDPKSNILPLLNKILETIPSPKVLEGDFQMLISSLDFDPHIGRLLVGKISRGKLKINDTLVAIENESQQASKVKGYAKKIFVREGLKYIEKQIVSSGEIIALAGVDSNAIGGTLCSANHLEALPTIKLSPPSVQAKFEASTSPFVGKDGKFVTAKQLQQRLEKEAETNISLKITKVDGGGYIVAGRGELQLGILIEELRREGFELQIRRPQVVTVKIDGIESEPQEELIIETTALYQGTVITALSERKANLVSMDVNLDNVILTYKILTRNLLGLRTSLINSTKGNLVMNHFVEKYVPIAKENIEIYRKGVLIASETGTSASYSLNTIQERGDLFIGGSEEVYEGMIVGINKYDMDLEVNVTKEREKSGVRRNQAEITQIALKAKIPLTLEFGLVFINDDEILEVTPNHIRLRKQYLTKTERIWAQRSNLSEIAKQKLGK